jgi:hypothetical protein
MAPAAAARTKMARSGQCRPLERAFQACVVVLGHPPGLSDIEGLELAVLLIARDFADETFPDFSMRSPIVGPIG